MRSAGKTAGRILLRDIVRKSRRGLPAGSYAPDIRIALWQGKEKENGKGKKQHSIFL
jgi:hypothetical protein